MLMHNVIFQAFEDPLLINAGHPNEDAHGEVIKI